MGSVVGDSDGLEDGCGDGEGVGLVVGDLVFIRLRTGFRIGSVWKSQVIFILALNKIDR